MKRFLAAMLTICIGILIPVSASQVRFCVVEHRMLGQEEPGCRSEKSSCCSEKDHTPDDCCLEVDELPDVPAISLRMEIPAIAVSDLPPPIYQVPPVMPVEKAGIHAAAPIRGPDPPELRRALLEVWRL